jgi:hypothetical protein
VNIRDARGDRNGHRCRGHRGPGGGRSRARKNPSSHPYWAIRLFCSTFTRLSVQKVQFGP